MYHFSNQPIVHHGYQQCSFFGAATVSQPGATTQRHEPESVVTLAPADLQPQGNSLPDDGAQAGERAEVKGAKKAVDTSSFSVEQRVVAAVWVHERHHTHTSMGQIKQQFMQRFGRAPPAKNTLLAWERKLFAAGAVHDAPRPGRPARSKLLVGAVLASLRAAPALSVRARAAALRVPRSTLRALLAAERCLHTPPPVACRGDRHVKKKAQREPRPPAPAEGFT